MRAGESFPPFPAASGTSTDPTKENAPNLVNNPLSATTGPFQLNGGKYWFVAQGGTFNGGTVALQRLGPNGVGFVTVGAVASVTADGGGVVDLPPGIYQVSLSTTGMVIYAEVVRINEE